MFRKSIFVILSSVVFCCKTQNNTKAMVSCAVIDQIIKNDKLVYGFCRETLRDRAVEDIFKLAFEYYNCAIMYDLSWKEERDKELLKEYIQSESKAIASLKLEDRLFFHRGPTFEKMTRDFGYCSYNDKLLKTVLEYIVNIYGNLPKVFFSFDDHGVSSLFQNYLTKDIGVPILAYGQEEYYIRCLYLWKYCLEYEGVAAYINKFISEKCIIPHESYKMVVKFVSGKLIESKEVREMLLKLYKNNSTTDDAN